MANQIRRRPRRTKPIFPGTGRARAGQAADAADRSDHAKRTQFADLGTRLPAPRAELGSFGANSLPEGGASAKTTSYDVTATRQTLGITVVRNEPTHVEKWAAAIGRMVAGMCLTRRSIRG